MLLVTISFYVSILFLQFDNVSNEFVVEILIGLRTQCMCRTLNLKLL